MKIQLGKLQRNGQPFSLPLAVVTMTLAILARKGRGKSYTAAVLAEEFLDAGQVPVIIDVTGAHWGLKASADSKSPGYPVVIFGGDHADLPLEENAGEVVARSIVEQRFAAIIDLSHFRKGQAYRFLAVFLETLYRINREPIHLLADEADYYAPQQPHGDQARVLGAMEDIVRRGRIRGIGCTLITQRPQVLNKNVLTQADMLIALGMNHPRDIGAIEEWVAVHGDMEKAKQMITSLPSLGIGTAWFWAPALDDTFEVVEIRCRKTFDSSATPKPGEKVVLPKKLAEIDVKRLGAEIEASVIRAKENDPAELRRQIAELKRQPAKFVPAPEPIIQEVHVMDKDSLNLIHQISARGQDLVAEAKRLNESGTAMLTLFDKLESSTRKFPMAGSTPIPRAVAAPFKTPPAPAPRGIEGTSRDPEVRTGQKLPRSESSVLLAIAQRHPRPCSRAQASLISGYSITSSSFHNALSGLRSGGLIEGGGDDLRLTTAGHTAVGTVKPMNPEDIQRFWLSKLAKAENALLTILIAAYPNPVSRTHLAAQSGYSETSSSFHNALSGLRSAELITRDRDPRATEILFEQ